jgi:hypothetical protein
MSVFIMPPVEKRWMVSSMPTWLTEFAYLCA